MADERTGAASNVNDGNVVDVAGRTFERIGDDPPIVDPATGASPADGNGGGSGSRRGRKPGSKNRNSTAKASSLDISGLEALLLSLHMMGATYLHMPELALEPKEAKQLSDAIGRVLAHYPVNIAPQSMDIVNLVMAIGMIYGSRIVAFRVRKSQSSARGDAKSPNVIDLKFTPPGASEGA